ncbi:AEC family transporter [Desulfovibrio sp. OttesenSCG-928-C06]|nr:AEC family transporter [Desulfovibrio sp. OttesenSCG-928-C06]
MANFIFIFFCLGAGFIAKRSGALPHDSFKAVNVWVVYFGLPAIAVRYIPTIDWQLEMIVPGLTPLIVWFGAQAFVTIYGKIRKIPADTRAVMKLGCGLGNTGFFGFPIAIAFFGMDGLSLALLPDIVTTTLFCTFGIITILTAANQNKDGRISLGTLVKKMFSFPVLSCALIVLPLSQVADISFIYPFLDLIVPTVAPLALFSIGLQFDFRDSGESMGYVMTAMLYKLIIAPALVLLFALAMGAKGDIAMLSVVMAGTPTHVVACVSASQFNLNPRLCALLVALTIIGALILLPAWFYVAQRIF